MVEVEVEVGGEEDDALAEDRSVDDEGSLSMCMSMDCSDDVVSNSFKS